MLTSRCFDHIQTADIYAQSIQRFRGTRGFEKIDDMCGDGDHLIKGHCVLQSTVSLSSGDSETDALAQGGAAVVGLQSLLAGWRLSDNVKLATDSTAILREEG